MHDIFTKIGTNLKHHQTMGRILEVSLQLQYLRKNASD